jgi:signal transduction histidine kinase/ligand-binding sensor domain-containing protein
MAFAIWLHATTAVAQYRVDVWTTEQGLPQNIVRAVHMGRDGYLWATTLDGLVRFDGLRFTSFDRSNSKGIASNRFSPLLEASDGALWLGTENGGITRYFQGRFTTYTTHDGLASNAVSGITADDDGRLWALSGDRIVEWNGRGFQLTTRTASLRFLVSEWATEVFWAIDGDRLVRFSRGALTARRLPEAVAGRVSNRIEEDATGTIWLTLTDHRYAHLAGGEVLRVVKIFPAGVTNDEQRPPDPDSVTTYTDRHARTWPMSVDAELGRRLHLPGGTPAEVGVAALYEDEDGNLWLGTPNSGLQRVRQQTVMTYSRAHGLLDRTTYAIFQDRSGAIWIGGWDRGLTRYENGKFTSFTTSDRLANRKTMALAQDRSGRLWIATRDSRNGGLSVFEHGRLRRVNEAIVPDGAWVAAIHEDRTGAIWFGTTRGLVRYVNGGLRTYTTADGLAGDDVRVIIDGGADRLWIGTYGGLSLLEHDRLASWTERDGLPSNSVRALYLDRAGVLWIGTYDGGLGRFENGKFTAVTVKDGLYNNGVFQILEDDTGRFWMTSNRGIHRVAKAQLNAFAAGTLSAVSSSSFGKSDGMLSEECNGGIWPAGTRANDGRLWLPTQDGVAVIDPTTVTANRRTPTPRIESGAIDGSPIPTDRPVHIIPGQENLEIRYTGLAFINADRVVFRYRLQGVDRDWVYAGTRRLAHYAHIPPGQYVFSVLAANSDGVWAETPATLGVVVRPPYWQTWTFQAGAGLGALGLAVFAYRRRVAGLRRDTERQQAFARQLIAAQEAERQRIATELHDGLGQNLLIVKNRALLGRVASRKDDIESAGEQLDEIAATAGDAIDEVRQIAYNLRPYHLDRLGLPQAIEEMATRVASSSSMAIDVDVAALEGAVAREDAINCYRIVQECLSNAVRHARATTASIRAAVESGEVRLTVADNGSGFDPRGAAAARATGGLGMVGVAERARMLGGSHTVTSRPGAGTTIAVRFPASSGREQTS